MKEPYVPPETMERMKKFFLKTSVPRMIKEKKEVEKRCKEVSK